MGFLVLILAGYMLIFGALPLGRFPFIGKSHVTGSDAWTSRGDLFFRIAGASLLLAGLIPDKLLEPWFGGAILGLGGVLMIFVGIIASLSGRAL